MKTLTAQAWAWEQTGLKPSSKLVLLALAMHVNWDEEEWSCFPKIKTIARECDLGERTVETALQELKDKNLIFIEPRLSSNGSRTSNRYLLYGPSAESAPPLAQNLHHPSAESAPQELLNESLQEEREETPPVRARARGSFQRKEKVKASAAPLCKRCETRHWSTQDCAFVQPQFSADSKPKPKTDPSVSSVSPPAGLETLGGYIGKHFGLDANETFWRLAQATKERGVDLEEQIDIYIQNCRDNKRVPTTSGLMSWFRNANPPRRTNNERRRTERTEVNSDNPFAAYG